MISSVKLNHLFLFKLLPFVVVEFKVLLYTFDFVDIPFSEFVFDFLDVPEHVGPVRFEDMH